MEISHLFTFYIQSFSVNFEKSPYTREGIINTIDVINKNKTKKRVGYYFRFFYYIKGKIYVRVLSDAENKSKNSRVTHKGSSTNQFCFIINRGRGG